MSEINLDAFEYEVNTLEDLKNILIMLQGINTKAYKIYLNDDCINIDISEYQGYFIALGSKLTYIRAFNTLIIEKGAYNSYMSISL